MKTAGRENTGQDRILRSPGAAPTSGDAYYYHRAEAELVLAQRALHPGAVKAHYVLAGFYLDRFYGAPDDQELPERS